MSFYAPVQVKKARRTTRRQNSTQVRFENSMTAKTGSRVGAALRSLRNVTTEAEVQRLYEAGKARDIPKLFKPGATKDFFEGVADLLEEAAAGGAGFAVKALRPGIAAQSRLDISNDRFAEYVSTRTGALIKGVPDDMQVIVQDSVRVGLASGQSPQQIARSIMDGVGLDANRARAAASYQGSDKQKFIDSMTDARAELIARTEVSFAINHGQVETWKQAVDDGLMGEDSKKVWITDPNPCPKICELMDGVEVALDEEFILPDGAEVPAPPAHPRCRCQTGILEQGGVKPTSGRKRDDGVDGEDNESED